MCPASQLGCNGWGQDPVSFPLEYTDHAGDVETWTGGTNVTGPACANTTKPPMPTTYNSNWLHMSIVDLSGYAGTPSFSYPNTAMSAWLCASDTQGTYNNSGSQGMLFYQQITQQSQINWPNYQINAVNMCDAPEGYATGTPPANWVAILQNAGLPTTAQAAVAYDMSNPRSAARCMKRH